MKGVERVEIIWNLTRACPWDCRICCVCAFKVGNSSERLVYLQAKDRGEELTLSEKLTVLKILAEKDCEVDFSGGDALYSDEDFRVIEEATHCLPSAKISVSMTGNKISEAKIGLLKRVGVVEFTLDNLLEMENPWRPVGYNRASMLALEKCIAAGIKTRAVTVFYPATMTERNLESIYHWLCKNRIPEWELLRFYPVGRGSKFIEFTPPPSEYIKAMKFLRGLQGFTKIFFQHSLRMLEENIKCPAGIESIGILPDGTVTACAWTINESGHPYPEFRLGKLPEENLDEILERARRLPEFCQEVNFCRTIAYSRKNNQKEVK